VEEQSERGNQIKMTRAANVKQSGDWYRIDRTYIWNLHLTTGMSSFGEINCETEKYLRGTMIGTLIDYLN